jgi:hypothetical protein
VGQKIKAKGQSKIMTQLKGGNATQNAALYNT